jgi:hypothetical protein
LRFASIASKAYGQLGWLQKAKNASRDAGVTGCEAQLYPRLIQDE